MEIILEIILITTVVCLMVYLDSLSRMDEK